MEKQVNPMYPIDKHDAASNLITYAASFQNQVNLCQVRSSQQPHSGTGSGSRSGQSSARSVRTAAVKTQSVSWLGRSVQKIILKSDLIAIVFIFPVILEEVVLYKRPIFRILAIFDFGTMEHQVDIAQQGDHEGECSLGLYTKQPLNGLLYKQIYTYLVV